MTAEELLNELQKGKRVKAVNAPAEYGRHWNGGEYEYITVYSYSGGEYRKVEWCSADFGGYCSAWGGFNADCDRCGWGEDHREGGECYGVLTEGEVKRALAKEVHRNMNDPRRNFFVIEE